MKNLRTLVKAIIGLALIVIGAYSIYAWREAVLVLVKACLGIFMVLLGLIFLAIAKE